MIRYLEIADDVEVYVVGDIHGCYSELMSELKRISFDFSKDMLISVGDLVDRGYENIECVKLLPELWFEAVRGNHEEFCIEGAVNQRVEFYHKMGNNGGNWFYDLPEDERFYIRMMMDSMPIALDVYYKGKTFGFLHGDCPVDNWNDLLEMIENEETIDCRPIKDYILWGRGIITKDEYVDIEGVHNIFFGHTVLEEVTQIGNCTFLDTGCVFKNAGNNYKLSIVKLSDYV